MFTVAPHVLPHGEPTAGGWHCRINGPVLDGDRWRPGMSTLVFIAALRPLAVQVDLFGNPSPPDVRRPRRPAHATA